MKKNEESWYYTFLPYNIAGGSTSPLIPLFVTEGLKGSLTQVGIVSAISSIASVPGNILWGNLSDTTKKRRPFVLLGFGGMAFALFMMAISTTISSYYLANFFFGLLACAAAPVGTVLVLESFGKHEWARRLGDFSKVGGIGWVAGLILGSLWLEFMPGAKESVFSLRGLFLVASLLALASLFLALKWVPEPEEKVRREHIEKNILDQPLIVFEKVKYFPHRLLHILRISTRNLSMRNFPSNLKKYYIMTFLAFTGFLTFYVGLPIYLRNYVGISNSEVFVVFLASSAVSAITYSIAGRWVARFGGKKTQLAAFVGRIVLFPSFFAVTFLPLTKEWLIITLCILHGLIGFCWANLSVAGNALVSNMSYSEFRTESLGIYSAIQGLGSIMGSFIGGIIAEYFGFFATFVIASLFVLCAAIILMILDVEKGPSEQADQHAIHT
ncbi:MAG: MFS transporter [Methanomassiliicoccales archaeon]|jgi:MFS family permease|nr:MFS transporter [Methanomassiliicoccales archaeon]